MPAASRTTGVPAEKRRTRGAPRSPGRLYDEIPLARRLHDLQRTRHLHLSRRDTLLDMVRAVHSSAEPEQIAEAIVSRAATWLPVTCWAVVGADNQGQLGLLAVDGHASGIEQPARVVASWVLAHDETFAAANLSTDTRAAADYQGAVIALPLRGREQTTAVLVGFDRVVSSMTPSMNVSFGRTFETLLVPAGFALDSAMALKRAEALSVTDDLTRLYNGRYLNMALRRETRLARRAGRPVSLLFVDLDGFKSINDNHGHLAGSRALVEAGAVIRLSARETDIVARFGGDEFALVLPDTGASGALSVAERVRDRIARHGFLAAEGLDIHLTASIGVATLPDVASTPDELVQAADGAMYRVKDYGKNGIQCAAPRR